MKIIVQMPWERDLSHNLYRFGKPSPKARGKWKKLRVRKPHVQDWMQLLSELIIVERLTTIAEGRYPPHVKLPVYISVDMWFPDKRRRDDHNYHKIICDAVSKALRIDDEDIRISTRFIERGVGKADAGFTIEISDEAEWRSLVCKVCGHKLKYQWRELRSNQTYIIPCSKCGNPFTIEVSDERKEP